MATPRRTMKVPLDLEEAIDRFIDKSKGYFRSGPELVSAVLEKFSKAKKRAGLAILINYRLAWLES
jgi:hypothetical protein